tara:strand:+ start:265 stop:696 length:432 start_codon:yes stop_codon:yes gene_type:complete
MDNKLIKEATSNLELIDIHLYSSEISRFEDIYQDHYPDDMSQETDVNLSAELAELKNGRKTLKVKASLSAIYKQDDRSLSIIKATFLAVYNIYDDISEEAISEFVRHNSLHNVWPFWREHAYRMSAEAKLPRPHIALQKPISS